MTYPFPPNWNVFISFVIFDKKIVIFAQLGIYGSAHLAFGNAGAFAAAAAARNEKSENNQFDWNFPSSFQGKKENDLFNSISI